MNALDSHCLKNTQNVAFIMFSKLAKMNHFWHFQLAFVHSMHSFDGTLGTFCGTYSTFFVDAF